MRKYISSLLIVIAVFFTSCASEDFELSKTVFIEDTDFPGLPIYSEWGYNTFGAYIDRNVFVSTYNDLPAKIIVHPDTFNLYLNGSMNQRNVSLKIELIGYAPADYPDLISLNDSVVNLKDENCHVTLTEDMTSTVLKIIQGEIHFKRVQNLYIDKVYTKTIISGTFKFKTFFGDEPVAITNGRFDLGIGYENFYNY
ncbi:MAG: hypothetical protein LLF95_07615 [Bacteroidales bacterium]|nr:hypothetical protein [Bacteroidales bacterium]